MGWPYRSFVRPVQRLQSSEGAHGRALRMLRLASSTKPGRGILRRLYRPKKAKVVNVWGLSFPNRFGLAAGMDKKAEAIRGWESIGFGFVEVGGVTMHAQQGNPKPRMFRDDRSRSLINRMGFNNDGAQALRRTLERQRLDPPGRRPAVLGINVGKSKVTALEQAPEDYASSLELLAPLADYAVINVSSPNTPGLRDLQDSSQLRRLVERLRRLPACPPLLVKIAPDLEDEAIDGIARLAFEEGLAGVIAVNTSLDRLGLEQRRLLQTGRTLAEEAGGLSGAPLRQRALEVIRRLRASAGPALTLIGVGGIDSAETAWERITAGASLIQLYTGWIFQGPDLVPRILEGLQLQLDRHGFRSIAEAVGSGLPWLPGSEDAES